MLKRSHLSELSLSRFTSPKRTTRLHTPFPNAQSARPNIQAQNDWVATNPTQIPGTFTVSFQFTTNSILPVKPTLSCSLLPNCLSGSRTICSCQKTRLVPSETQFAKEAGLQSWFYFLRVVVNISIQILISSPWLLLGNCSRTTQFVKGSRETKLVFNGRVSW